jgi:hypothetical protein
MLNLLSSNVPNACWSNSANFIPLMLAHIVSGHLAQNWQLCVKCKAFNFSLDVCWKYEPAVLGENFLNIINVMLPSILLSLIASY